MTFKIRFATLLFLFILIPQMIFAQEVSTLIFDSTKRFEAMHWLPDGRIISVDYFNGSVYDIFLDGTLETKLTGFTNLAGGGYDMESNFYVSNINSGEILKLNDDGTYDVIADDFSGPISILQDPVNPDKFYVSEYTTSEVSSFLLSTGERTAWVEDNGIFKPDGLTYDWNGDMLVANFENHKINRIDADGNISQYTDLGVPKDMGYIEIVGEYLYVPSFSGRQLYRVDQEGVFEVIAGSGSSGSDDGTGIEATFRAPNGICSNPAGDTLLVSDRNSIRVVTNFEPSATSITEIAELDLFNISPNPSSETINIRLAYEPNGPVSFTVFDAGGNQIDTLKVIKSNSCHFVIDIEPLKSGIYTLHLLSRNNKSSKKFVKVAQ